MVSTRRTYRENNEVPDEEDVQVREREVRARRRAATGGRARVQQEEEAGEPSEAAPTKKTTATASKTKAKAKPKAKAKKAAPKKKVAAKPKAKKEPEPTPSSTPSPPLEARPASPDHDAQVQEVEEDAVTSEPASKKRKKSAATTKDATTKEKPVGKYGKRKQDMDELERALYSDTTEEEEEGGGGGAAEPSEPARKKSKTTAKGKKPAIRSRKKAQAEAEGEEEQREDGPPAPAPAPAPKRTRQASTKAKETATRSKRSRAQAHTEEQAPADAVAEEEQLATEVDEPSEPPRKKSKSATTTRKQSAAKSKEDASAQELDEEPATGTVEEAQQQPNQEAGEASKPARKSSKAAAAEERQANVTPSRSRSSTSKTPSPKEATSKEPQQVKQADDISQLTRKGSRTAAGGSATASPSRSKSPVPASSPASASADAQAREEAAIHAAEEARALHEEVQSSATPRARTPSAPTTPQQYEEQVLSSSDSSSLRTLSNQATRASSAIISRSANPNSSRSPPFWKDYEWVSESDGIDDDELDDQVFYTLHNVVTYWTHVLARNEGPERRAREAGETHPETVRSRFYFDRRDRLRNIIYADRPTFADLRRQRWTREELDEMWAIADRDDNDALLEWIRMQMIKIKRQTGEERPAVNEMPELETFEFTKPGERSRKDIVKEERRRQKAEEKEERKKQRGAEKEGEEDADGTISRKTSGSTITTYHTTSEEISPGQPAKGKRKNKGKPSVAQQRRAKIAAENAKIAETTPEPPPRSPLSGSSPARPPPQTANPKTPWQTSDYPPSEINEEAEDADPEIQESDEDWHKDGVWKSTQPAASHVKFGAPLVRNVPEGSNATATAQVDPNGPRFSGSRFRDGPRSSDAQAYDVAAALEDAAAQPRPSASSYSPAASESENMRKILGGRRLSELLRENPSKSPSNNSGKTASKSSTESPSKSPGKGSGKSPSKSSSNSPAKSPAKSPNRASSNSSGKTQSKSPGKRPKIQKTSGLPGLESSYEAKSLEEVTADEATAAGASVEKPEASANTALIIEDENAESATADVEETTSTPRRSTRNIERSSRPSSLHTSLQPTPTQTTRARSEEPSGSSRRQPAEPRNVRAPRSVSASFQRSTTPTPIGRNVNPQQRRVIQGQQIDRQAPATPGSRPAFEPLHGIRRPTGSMANTGNGPRMRSRSRARGGRHVSFGGDLTGVDEDEDGEGDE